MPTGKYVITPEMRTGHHIRPHKPPINYICQHCGVQFFSKTKNRKFCSSSCANSVSTKAAWKNRSSERRKEIASKISKALTGKKLTEEHKENVSRGTSKAIQIWWDSKSLEEMSEICKERRKDVILLKPRKD